MALKTPPSWLQNGSHPAVNDRLTQQALFNTTGIIGTASLAVTGTSGLGLSVASGWAAIQANAGSGLGVYTIYNDAANALTISAYAVTNTRIDKVVATVSDSAIPYGSGDTVAFAIVTGTEAVSPTAPATPSNSIALATVLVPVGSGAITITDARTFITSNAFLPLGGGTVAGATTFSGGLATSAATTETLGAGTNTVPPLVFSAGSNGATATGAVAGAVEFDGKVAYFTPATSSGRSLLDSSYRYQIGTAVSGTNVTTIQPLFSSLSNGLFVQAGTLYEFEIVAAVTQGNATSKTITLTLGGTATQYSVEHHAVLQNASLAGNISGSVTNAIAFTTNTSASNNIVWKGFVRVNVGGYLLPQITFSVAPTTVSVVGGIKVTPIATAVNGTANLSVGAWS